MVSWSGHLLPVIVTIAIWFLATGLIAWLDNRERSTFPLSLTLAGIAGIAGFCAVTLAMTSATIAAVYISFGGALLVWSWHELGFLTGAVTGTRREACPQGASYRERFSRAVDALSHHEIALAVTALLLVSITWNAANQVGAMTFALLYVMRLSTKLNIFHGVPNSATDILPPHLAYLKSYYGPNRFSLPLLASAALALGLALWLGTLAWASPAGSAEAVGASLLFALAALGALEHLFLTLPFRDGMLWGWALPRPGSKSRAAREHQMTREEG
ncbi:MAG: putative photosynthetic complex assembly protein PuhE [Sphingomonadaceae bacterium]